MVAVFCQDPTRCHFRGDIGPSAPDQKLLDVRQVLLSQMKTAMGRSVLYSV